MKPEYIYMNVIAPSFILVPVIAILVRYSICKKEARVLLLYLFAESAIIIISSLLAYRHLPNMPLYHFGTIAETVLLLYFFSIVFESTPAVKYIKWIMLLFPVLSVVNTLFVQHIYQFNSYPISLQFILIIGLCFFYWWHHSDDEDRPWGALPLNWIISGIMLYFSSSFVLFTFSNIIITSASKAVSVVIWNIHATFAAIMYLMMGAGICKYKKI